MFRLPQQPVRLKPLHVLQCHSKEDSSEDFSTQLWACAFQPGSDSSGTDERLVFAHTYLQVNRGLNDASKIRWNTFVLATTGEGGESRLVATCGGDSLCVIDCETGMVMKKYKVPGEVRLVINCFCVSGSLYVDTNCWVKNGPDEAAGSLIRLLYVTPGVLLPGLVHSVDVQWRENTSSALQHPRCRREEGTRQTDPSQEQCGLRRVQSQQKVSLCPPLQPPAGKLSVQWVWMTQAYSVFIGCRLKCLTLEM